MITIIFQLLLILTLLTAAITATFSPKILKRFANLFSQSRTVRILQAIILWFATIANCIGITVPFVVFFASCFGIISSIPLIFRATHLKMASSWILPIVILVVSVTVGILQPLGLKVIALPKADDLPQKLCASRVVKTYDEGLWFEGIASDNNGTLYLSGNRNLDFSRKDYYHNAEGELIERKSDGSERILFKTPKGQTSGVPFIAADKSIYITSHGAIPCIWHIDISGKGEQLVKLPNGAWPNGLDQGPDSMLYTPDSNLGVIWKINPKSKKAEIAISDPKLKARPFISLAPGANGLRFKGNNLFVTVSDGTTLLKYSIDAQGNFGKSSIITSGIPGDDFAIAKDGTFFITTHPYNTIVRVSPNGKDRAIVAKMEQHIIGATCAVFGKTPQDKNILYVVTDGGAFTGGPKTRGELIALEPYK